MHKLLLSSAAGLALAASAGAFAQLPPCQPGLVWGGCQPLQMSSDTRVLGAGPASAAVASAELQPYALGVATEIRTDGSVHQYAKPYPRTAADHDGDGIPNRYDRFPQDPRFF
jgi:hypothetical protein